jgi:glycosyltransferase involved in cell wall biosynthesis
LVDQLGLGSNILFLGYRSNMPEVYASLDLFVLASVNEGMPMTILEALAARRPVVATRVGAVEKVITPEQTGLLVEARDVAALRDAMLKCLRDLPFARELGRKGAEHVRRNFSAEAMAKNYLDVYQKVLDEQGRKAPAMLQHV